MIGARLARVRLGLAVLAVPLALAGCSGSSTPQSKCLSFPTTQARELVAHPNGKVTAASAVKSPEAGFKGRTVYAVAIRTGQRNVLLAHPVTDPSKGPTGPGLWGTLDTFSQQATGFPINKNLATGVDTGLLQEATACL